MFATLRSRLIISYVAVVLPALLLATLVYLVLSINYRQDDAYRQLETGMYLVAPQIENVLIRERIVTAVENVQDALLQITENALSADLPAPRRAQVLGAVARIQNQLLQIQDVLTSGTGGQGQIATAVAQIRDSLAPIETALGTDQAQPATGRIRTNLQQILNPSATSLSTTDRNRILRATESIRGELQNTKFRLLIVRPEGSDGRVLLDSLTGNGNRTGLSFGLPDALLNNNSLAQPVRGQWSNEPSGDWIYEIAPPELLVAKNAAPLVDPATSRFFVVLAEHQPNFVDVVNDFIQLLVIFGIVALIVALALGFVLARSITRPLGALAAATHEIAQGNYTHQAPVTGSAETQALAADFNRMAAQVERTQQAQRDFLANVSHDLKTPLTSIQGFSQAMIDGALRDRAAFVEAAGVINAESQRMARLVGDLIDLVRLQSGETPIHKQPIDIRQLLTQAAAGMQPQATERHVELRIESDSLPPIDADPDRLRRALTNLVDNALRYTPPEGRVTLHAEGRPGAVRISVRDTGSGIPAEELPRVFERFYQVDKSRAGNGHGSGLGLAIVREIATAHGGDVLVESQPGSGSEFTITLPI
jgi:signal transduction histidine kinase